MADNCVELVGTLPCANSSTPEGSSTCGSHRIEDQAVGLCMHLKQVRLIDCPAFHGDQPCDVRPHAFNKSCALGTPQARLSAFPLTIHRLKKAAAHDQWWRMLVSRGQTPQTPENASSSAPSIAKLSVDSSSSSPPPLPPLAPPADSSTSATTSTMPPAEGWVELLHPTYHTPYHFNTITGQRAPQWKPSLPVPLAAAMVPSAYHDDAPSRASARWPAQPGNSTPFAMQPSVTHNDSTSVTHNDSTSAASMRTSGTALTPLDAMEECRSTPGCCVRHPRVCAHPLPAHLFSLRQHQEALQRAVEAGKAACRGCRPARAELRAQREAYVLVWNGGPTVSTRASAVGSVQWAHVGLAVACHSIRKHDAVRPILILSLEHAREAVARELELLVRHYAPLQVLPMTELSKAPMVVRTCSSYAGAAAAGNGTGGGMTVSSDKDFSRIRRGTLAPMFNKFNVFGLAKFARLLYLDTDVAVTKSLEQLWELVFQPHQFVAAAHTTGWGLAICSKHNVFSPFNAGVFLLRPSAGVYEVLKATMADLAMTKVVSCSNGDQMMWNRLFAQVCLRYAQYTCMPSIMYA